MQEIEQKKSYRGVRHITVAVESTTSFKDLVTILEKTLVVPELPGVRGCGPCLSGLDRFVLEDLVLPAIR
ncbi:MAG: hypothetical protein ABIS20_23635 [Thermoanaerobaculia bacterium]